MTSVSASPPCRFRVASMSRLRRPPADLTGNRAKQTTRSGFMGFLSSPVALWAPARKSCQRRAPLDELPRSAAPLVCAPFGSVAAARYEPRKMDPTYDHLLCALNSCISLTFSLTMHHASVTAMSAWSATIATASASWEPPMKNSADHMVAEHTPSPQLKPL